MRWPLLDPLRDLLAAHGRDAAGRVVTTTATVFLAVVAMAFLIAAGLAALTAEVGFPVAALVFSALFAVLALAVYFVGRRRSARRAAQIADARKRAEADIAPATKLARSAQPLAPLAVFLAAFMLARRQ
jgi:membrane protein DedA with SNARE-associated domain